MDWIVQEQERIANEIKSFGDKRIVCSSSFQTHSIPLLHLLQSVHPGIPVYFLNSGFHFPETHRFKHEIISLLDLNVINIEPDIDKSQQLDARGRFWFATDPDRCCEINKTLPMEQILKTCDVWISGLRSQQTEHRAGLKPIEKGAYGTLKYHPILTWTSKMIHEYRTTYHLPTHPLEAEGYLSIGCEPCTSKFNGTERSGRWNGMKKTECGLHMNLGETK